MTTCRPDCGACCDPLMLPYNRLEAMTNPQITLDLRKWAARSLTTMGNREAYRLAPWLKGKMLRDQFDNLVEPNFFRCAHFDRETRMCTDYDNRPPMCRHYPWYGDEPREDASLPPMCSFNVDIGRQPQPVPVRLTEKPDG